jgi:futalosine hydrolase
MKILLVSATDFEIQPTIDILQSCKYKVHSQEISVLITGIGSTATTYFLTKQIYKTPPELIVQAGIAGCFTNHELGSTFLVNEDRFADLGVMEDNKFKNIFDLGLSDKDAYPFTNGSLHNPHKGLLNMIITENVRAITVNEITTDAKKIKWYKQNGGPAVESMEGAALHYVCLLQKIPFLQVRSISNYVGERDKTKWELKKSVKALNEKIISLIEKIAEHDEI